jgi:hypothetical protein
VIPDLIAAERDHQREKWGGFHEWGVGDCSSSRVADYAKYDDPATLLRLAVLVEEVGEVARAVMEHDAGQVHTELVQVAAVAVAWLEAFENADEDY